MLGVTRKELMIAAPAFAKDFVDAFTAVLSQLRDGGVSVQVMMAGDWDFKRIAEVGEARVRDNLFGGGVIADGKEAILFLGEAEIGGSYSGLLVIWSNHVGLVKFAREYFQLLWDTAKPA
jgi:hypothetical protein